jgi:hypothetical protein
LITSTPGETRVDDSVATLSNNDPKSLTDISLKRQKLVRQKSFEIDSSDDAEDLNSIVEKSAKIVENSTKAEKVEKATKPEKTSKPSKTSKTPTGTKKRPDLTIKICDSSFDAGAGEPDPASDAFRSPSLHISGISISRSPPGVNVIKLFTAIIYSFSY